MSSRFDDWVRSTLNPDLDPQPRPGEVRRLVADLQPQRARRRRVMATAGLAVVVIALVLFAQPRMIGSDAGRHELTRVLPDGRYVIQQPLTGSGTIVESLDEIDKWDRVVERTAAGEERIYQYTFFRYRGKLKWSVAYMQGEGDQTQYFGRQPTYRPKSNMSPETILSIIAYLDPLIGAAEARDAIPCPPERHDIDGVLVDFEVWAADFPEIGRLEYGLGKPPVQ
jgi:hypothetical protein